MPIRTPAYLLFWNFIGQNSEAVIPNVLTLYPKKSTCIVRQNHNIVGSWCRWRITVWRHTIKLINLHKWAEILILTTSTYKNVETLSTTTFDKNRDSFWMIYCLCCPVWSKSKKSKLSTLFDEKQQINNRIEDSVKSVPIMMGRKRRDSVILNQPELVIEASKVDAPEADTGVSAAPAGPAGAMAAIAPVAVVQEVVSSESDISSSASSLTSNESSSETDLTYGTYDSSSSGISTQLSFRQ